jgi:5-methylphenazine-1-carboxylate 1-monooxygenase
MALFALLALSGLPANDNRMGGPGRVIDVVEEHAPDGFTNLEDIASHAELEAIVKGYAKMAGFNQAQVNR